MINAWGKSQRSKRTLSIRNPIAIPRTGSLLALDLATVLGWATLDADGKTESGYHKLCGGSRPEKLAAYGRWLKDKLALQPSAVVYEAPVLPRLTRLETLTFLNGLVGITEMLCFERMLPVFQIHAQTARHVVLGNGRLKKTEIVKTIGYLFPGDMIKDHNQADALVLLEYARAIRRQT